MWVALKDYGVEGKLLAAVQSLYEDSGRKEVIHVRKGVRQGCPLSPWLFNIFIDRIV